MPLEYTLLAKYYSDEHMKKSVADGTGNTCEGEEMYL